MIRESRRWSIAAVARHRGISVETVMALLPSATRSVSQPGSQPAATPFEAAYEAIVAALSRATFEGAIREARRVFGARTGEVDDDDDGFEGRMAAFWDSAVTSPELLGRLHGVVGPEYEPWLVAFGSAHRGLFVVEPEADDHRAELVLRDVWSGASFFVRPLPRPETLLALRGSEGLFDGRLVGRATPLEIALLPGAFFHPPDATGAIEAVLAAARGRAPHERLATADVLDALMHMEARLRGHSRVKAAYAYRAERLPKK